MKNTPEKIAVRKKEHLELCSTDEVAFKSKMNGFQRYDFLHNAATEVKLDEINFQKKFFNKKVNFPFIISCMTGGFDEADNINLQLAEAASSLNIPLGIGSQRYALGNNEHYDKLKEIRKKAASIPVLGNIGAAQVAKGISMKNFKLLIELVEADAMVIHLNPLQELIQKEGEPDFTGLIKNVEAIVKEISIPLIIKEVGAGISKQVAKIFLDVGVSGIDVAGAGGTSWSGVEQLREKNNKSTDFWEWGLPTSYCIRKIRTLKKNYKFMLVGSGGINTSFDGAKALALGADYFASARIVFQELNRKGIEGVIKMIEDWFEDIKKIMFLTGRQTLEEFDRNILIKTEELY